jgi:SAM-dependent methyltransferase
LKPAQTLLAEMLRIYATPSESLWRSFELVKVLELRDSLRFDPPILEIGCGNGAFTSMVMANVDDAVDINRRAVERARHSPVFKRVHCMDARAMSFETGSYGTVFANCVLEHIPSVEQILADCARVLRSGGRMIATVPLREMNAHLLFKHPRYAAHRQAQLVHVNLLSPEEWREALLRAGFARVDVHPYLFGGHCRLWDKLDWTISMGSGRYRLSAALRLALWALPAAVRRRLEMGAARWLARRLDGIPERDACAAALVATKS